MELAGSSALVTGAASGLGAATASALAGAGWRWWAWIWPVRGTGRRHHRPA